MEEQIREHVKTIWAIIRWFVIAYSTIVFVGFHLFRLPDWIMEPALLYTKLIKGIFSLVLPDGISAVIAIFATIITPVIVIIYSSSEG